MKDEYLMKVIARYLKEIAKAAEYKHKIQLSKKILYLYNHKSKDRTILLMIYKRVKHLIEKEESKVAQDEIKHCEALLLLKEGSHDEKTHAMIVKTKTLSQDRLKALYCYLFFVAHTHTTYSF